MSEYTPEVARAAVDRGAAWLDCRCSDWPARIDLDVLDLSNPAVCMLGQTEDCIVHPAIASWDDGYHRVVFALGLRDATAVWLGFNVPEKHDVVENTAQFEMLTITWRELIRERLAEQSSPNGVTHEVVGASA